MLKSISAGSGFCILAYFSRKEQIYHARLPCLNSFFFSFLKSQIQERDCLFFLFLFPFLSFETRRVAILPQPTTVAPGSLGAECPEKPKAGTLKRAPSQLCASVLRCTTPSPTHTLEEPGRFPPAVGVIFKREAGTCVNALGPPGDGIYLYRSLAPSPPPPSTVYRFHPSVFGARSRTSLSWPGAGSRSASESMQAKALPCTEGPAVPLIHWDRLFEPLSPLCFPWFLPKRSCFCRDLPRIVALEEEGQLSGEFLTLVPQALETVCKVLGMCGFGGRGVGQILGRVLTRVRLRKHPFRVETPHPPRLQVRCRNLPSQQLLWSFQRIGPESYALGNRLSASVTGGSLALSLSPWAASGPLHLAPCLAGS